MIPPAWKEVWTCPSPDGHIQAVGTDDAGRRQYLYHHDRRERQDQEERCAWRTPGRTWHATILAAVGLAVSEPAADTTTGKKRAIARVIREVADYLGNTPVVAERAYIDPRVITLYEKATTIASALAHLGEDHDFGELATQSRAEQAVLKLLTE